MSARFHVVHTVASIDEETSGVTICVRRLAEELGHLALNVRVLSLGLGGTVQRDGYTDVRYPTDWASIPVLRAMSFSKAMEIELQSRVQQVDVIHNHGLWQMPNVYGGQLAGKRQHTQLVFSPHGMLCPGALNFSRAKKRAFWWTLQRSAANAAACFHATCEEEYEDIRKFGLTAPVAIIPNGVDLPQWQEKTLGRGRRQVVSLGRIHPKKALDRLIAAWARLEPEFPQWDLLIVGPNENNHAEELAAQVKTLDLQNVTIAGPVFDTEKNELLQASDLFALPTLTENFALTVAESLAVGTPVISTKGAPWQGLVENECGWWIDHGVEPLAAALREAMSLSSEERAAMGKKGRAWMERDFAWKAIAKQMVEVYRWLCTDGDAPDTVRI